MIVLVVVAACTSVGFVPGVVAAEIQCRRRWRRARKEES